MTAAGGHLGNHRETAPDCPAPPSKNPALLSARSWKLTDEDRRGLTASFRSDGNPYATFRPERDKRLDLAPAAAVPRPRTATDDTGPGLEIVEQ